MKRLLLLTAGIVMVAAAASGCGARATPPAATQSQNPATIAATESQGPATTAAPTTPPEATATLTPEGGQVADYATFVAALISAGAPAEEIGPTENSMFSGTGHIIKVNGQEVQAFEYPSPADMEKEAANIAPDGSQFTDKDGVPAMIDWINVPHFFKKGRLMVVYVGRDEQTLEMLRAALGDQFAGG